MLRELLREVSRPKRLRVAALTTALAIFLPLSWIYFWLAPAWPGSGSSAVPKREVESYEEFKSIKERRTEELRPALPKLKQALEAGTHPLSPLVFVEFVAIAKPAPDKKSVVVEPLLPGRLRVRFDRLIWMLAGTVLMGLLAFFLQIMPKNPEPEAPETYKGMDFPSLVDAEISKLTEIGKRLYRRSRLLLFFGVAVAFSGVGALFFLIPNHFLLPSERLVFGPDKELFRDLQALLKASGLVLQIEAFAFILLRQYRATFEDFIYFHNLRLRYIHYLAASTAMESMQTDLGTKTGVYMANFLLGGDSFSAAASRKTAPAQKTEAEGAAKESAVMDKLPSSLSTAGTERTTSGNGGTP